MRERKIPLRSESPITKLTKEFRGFLIEARRRGYGTEGAQIERDPSNGSLSIAHRNDRFAYTDHWVGGNLYSGFEHVSAIVDEIAVPIWAMSYREIEKTDDIRGPELTSILGKVLSLPDPELPIRGPRDWQEGTIRYRIRPVRNGITLEDFDVEEFVHKDDKKVYIARFIGGLVNQDHLEVIKDKFWLEKN